MTMTTVNEGTYAPRTDDGVGRSRPNASSMGSFIGLMMMWVGIRYPVHASMLWEDAELNSEVKIL